MSDSPAPAPRELTARPGTARERILWLRQLWPTITPTELYRLHCRQPHPTRWDYFRQVCAEVDRLNAEKKDER